MFTLLLIFLMVGALVMLPSMSGQRQMPQSRRQVARQQQLSFDDAYAVYHE